MASKPFSNFYIFYSRKAYKLADLLNYLVSLTKEEVILQIDKVKYRPSNIPIMIGDNTKIREEIDLAPEIDIHDTLKDLLNYWRSIDR